MTMQFERDKFAEFIGTNFTLQLPDLEGITLELAEVSEIRERPHQRSFSLILLTPEGSTLEQGLYEVVHESLGPMAFFLVPVGMDGNRIMLEALFNFLKE